MIWLYSKLVEVQRVFDVSSISVKRALKKYKEHGAESFFIKKKSRRSRGNVFTEETTQKVQDLLDEGY